MHSSLLVSFSSTRIMIDCGADWLGQLGAIGPDAIVLTHAHADHSDGLKDGAPCPVYGTPATWQSLDRLPIELRKHVRPRSAFEIGAISLEAVPVRHSPIAPTVGYRITVEERSFFYVPDVLKIHSTVEVLSGIDLYIGDGARLEHPIIRGSGALASGHASIREQLSWCAGAQVRRALFTHCGTPIINANPTLVREALTALAGPLGIEASFACDGDQISLGPVYRAEP